MVSTHEPRAVDRIGLATSRPIRERYITSARNPHVRAMTRDSSVSRRETTPSDGQPGIASIAAVVGLWTILCIALPLWLTFPLAPVTRASTSGLIAQYLIALYAGTRIVILLVKGEPKWLQSMFWLFCYIWLGLAGLVQEATGNNPYDVQLSNGSVFTGSVVSLIGMAFYDIGIRAAAGFRAKVPKRRARQLDARRVLMLLATAPFLTLLLVQLTGGFSTLFVPRSERSASLQESGLLTAGNQAAGGVLTSLLIALPLVAAVSSIFLIGARSDLLKRPLGTSLSGINVALLLIVGNPISNPRFYAGTVILGLLLSRRQAHTPRGFRRTSLLILVALLVIFPYADYFRYASGVQPTNTESIRSLMTAKGDYDAPLQIATAADFRSATGGTHGGQILGVLGFFVPRSVWPDKPGSTGALLSKYVNFSELNVSSPLWIEAYVDGGYLALALGFLVLGIAASAFVPRGHLQFGSVSWVYPLVAMTAGYSLLVYRGSLLTSVGPLSAIVLLLVLLTKRGSASQDRPNGRIDPTSTPRHEKGNRHDLERPDE